jgi:hypothetical protein
MGTYPLKRTEAHQAFYPMGTPGSFQGVKRQRRQVNHSHQSSTEDKNAWSYISTSPYVFMAW